MEAVDKSLMEMFNVKDYDVSKFFKADGTLPKISTSSAEARKSRVETEDYYFEVIQTPHHCIGGY